MYPEIAIREPIANALVHQDFNETGNSVSIEIYSDRVEISNPGKPVITPDRFIDDYKSRNESLADVLRRMGICEELGSGIDKVIESSEVYQLPALDIRVSETRTIILLFAHKEFSDMTKADRIRACYQHCCLRYVTQNKMTNQSLRERFNLKVRSIETISRLLRETAEKGYIKLDDSSASKKYANYLPFWA